MQPAFQKQSGPVSTGNWPSFCPTHRTTTHGGGPIPVPSARDRGHPDSLRDGGFLEAHFARTMFSSGYGELIWAQNSN